MKPLDSNLVASGPDVQSDSEKARVWSFRPPVDEAIVDRPVGPTTSTDPVTFSSAISRTRVTVDGKFFRLGDAKFHPKGVTYGPFAPGVDGVPFADPEKSKSDFQRIASLGANLLRVYHVPPRWLLDLALEAGLRLLVDVPWNKHLCFLDSDETRQAAIRTIRDAARACAGHPGVFALSVVNEIPADIVRWSGADQVGEFIDELISTAKAEDPGLPCTFGNFPTTEFLRPERIDFLCFNVYLHERQPFENYLARLQMLADTKPLVLGEFGVDTIREGEGRQAYILGWKIESAFRHGCAGVVVYSFTDDWWTGGRQVDDWAFGLTRADRSPKPAFDVVKARFAIAPYFPLPTVPRVSVVVASYNGAATLKTCLQSLENLNYPDYEVILVDDGSTDNSQSIAVLFPKVRNIRHGRNQGLSVARNTGIEAATGDIVAFTDSDCRADEDWLFFLVGDLLRSRFTGIGGHNFLPPDDSPTAAAVMVSPGGPAHVMLNDRVAEHVPGCNMAFYRWALVEIGGFDPIYRKAGDDVDICWRLQQRGYRIGFSPSGFVWHYRRNTIRAYLKQQGGYGEAESLLERRHPENFNRFGGSMWHGRIYTPAKIGVETRRPVIYHGMFGSAPFQSIYTRDASLTLVVGTSLEFHALVTLPLLVVSAVVPFVWTLGVASLVFSLGLCFTAAWQAALPTGKRRVWSRPLVALLFLLQPIMRGWARHRGNLLGRQTPLSARETLESISLEDKEGELNQLLYWSEAGVDRMGFLARVLERLDSLGWQNKPDAGWSPFDVEIYGSRWARLQLLTAVEYHTGNRQMLRCRVRSEWSSFARVVFATVAGVELLFIGISGRFPFPESIATSPLRFWPWLILISLWPLAWRLNVAKRELHRLVVAFLDERAKEFKFVRVSKSE
jgi:GT2 family glycosyltransferase